MLTIAGVHNGTETASSTKDQHELHIAKLQELRNKDMFREIEVVDRHQVLSIRWVQEQWLDASYHMRFCGKTL